MKRLILQIIFLCLLIVLSSQNSRADEIDDLWKISAYCACEKCCGKWADEYMASGIKAKEGYVACNILPFGTKVNIEGLGIYEIQDRGAKKYFDNQKHIDIYFSNHQKAKEFGVKYKYVDIISKMYNLTEAGREHARLLLEQPSGEFPVRKAALAREIEAELKRLFASKVWKKVKSDHIEDITFYDACAFWGISPRSSAIELEGRFANFQKVVESAQKVIYGEKATFEHSGNVFGGKELNALLKIHKELIGKFQDEIIVIKKRTDERV